MKTAVSFKTARTCFTCADADKGGHENPCCVCLASPVYNRSHWRPKPETVPEEKPTKQEIQP